MHHIKENKGYISIGTHLPTQVSGKEPLIKNIDHGFTALLREVEKDFRKKIVELIDQKVGENNWAVYFRILPDEPSYIAHIFVNETKDYDRIARIIDEKIPDVIVACPYGGDVYDYLEMMVHRKDFSENSLNHN